MKKIILLAFLSSFLTPSFAYFTICKSNKGSNGYFRVCEEHGSNAHILKCEGPGDIRCEWMISPPTGEREVPCGGITVFVENNITNNQLTGQAIMGGVNFVAWAGTDLSNYSFTVYTIAEATQLGLLN
ncbi:MAG: hypothetical protein SGJ10_01635 [Bacteroidota bacterium]|nr:hypothetical protein [Bacteroidota bacterium]